MQTRSRAPETQRHGEQSVCILHFELRISVLQYYHRRPTAALIFRRGIEAGHKRVFLEIPGHRAAKLSRSVPVYDPQFAHVGDGGLIEELVETIQRFIDRGADQIQLAQGALAGL